MKKLSIVIFSFLSVLLMLVGCGNNLYYNYDMEKFVSLEDFSFDVDRKSFEYVDAIRNYYTESFGTALNYEATSGTVEYGDIVNLSYLGYCAGDTFLHGTGVNYDLKIGSDTFVVPGFEDGLIGAKIGKTVTLELTLPEDFINEEVAGKSATYNVTVNYAVKGAYPTDEDAKKFGFSSLKDYEDKADRYAIGVCIFQNAYDVASIKDYPEKESELLFDEAYKAFSKLCVEQGTTVNQYISNNGITAEELKEHIMIYDVQSTMDTYLVAYYLLHIFDSELTNRDIEEKRVKLEEKYNGNLLELGFDEINIQQAAAYDKVIDTLYNYAVIKE